MASRPRAWGDVIFEQALTDALQVNNDLLVTLAASDTVTVVRIIGHLTVIPNNLAGAIEGAMKIDLGIGVASKEAFDADVVPDATTAADVPARGWLWADRLVCTKQNTSGTMEDWHYPEVRFDVRAMRKIDRGVLYLQMNNNGLAGTGFTVTVVGRVRALCLT